MTVVTVIVAVRNGADHVDGAVRSVLNQTHHDLELLVIDDASTDGTADIARDAADGDRRLNIVSLPRNLGPSAARNAGLSRARGQWIAILDADDAWRPERLERLLNHARESFADMICDDLMVIDAGTGETIGPMFGPEMPNQISPIDFVLGNLPDPKRPRRGHGFLKPVLRSEFLAGRHIRYDESMRFAEDYAFYMDCLLAGANWIAYPEPLYVYSVRSDSLTSTHGAADLERLCRVDERALEHPFVKADSALHAALSRHLLSTRKRERWALFVDRYRERRFRDLPATVAYSPSVMAHIAACCLTEVVARSRRLVVRAAGRASR